MVCACDQAGLQLRRFLPHPSPSRLNHMGEIAKTLAPKLEVIPEFTDKFLLEKRGPLAGNTMLAGDPSCGGTLAQKMRADA
jgi:hypothetical protein